MDTGFLVFNARTYPNLINLLAELGVAAKSETCRFSGAGAGPQRRHAGVGGSEPRHRVRPARQPAVNWRSCGHAADLLRFGFNALATRMAGRVMPRRRR